MSAPAPAAVVNDEGMVATVIEVVVHHTGYPADFVELDQDLEGELGIDTVKQAEIMADIREKFGLPVDEDFVLADYPTLNHMIGYIQRMTAVKRQRLPLQHLRRHQLKPLFPSTSTSTRCICGDPISISRSAR